MIKAVVIATFFAAVAAQQDANTPAGYTQPSRGVQACQRHRFVADRLNLCWYHECIQGEDEFTFMPRSCPLGTRLPYTYRAGSTSPCLFQYHTSIGYECSRTVALSDVATPDGPPADCTLSCQNGGTLEYDNNIGSCWCSCPAEFQGEFDCSKPTGTTPPVVIGAGCADGQPPQDFCSQVGGCENGGNCTNQCDGFVCDCPSPDTYGKRCESFSCDVNGECLNGGTCRRGRDGRRQYRRCICPDGWFGLQCENSTDNLPIAGQTDPQGLGRDVGK